MTIHPDIAKVLSTLPAPDGSPLSPQAMRADEAAQVPPADKRLPLHAVADAIADTETGDVPVRIYTSDEGQTHGLLIYFHGGAFFLGSLDTHDHVARALARETGHQVISVGYRLAPEAAFPAGLEDCYAVVRWAAAHGETLGWDGRNLAIAGDSSGGNFVAAVAGMARDRGFTGITHQILFYPSVDLDFDEGRYPSMRENAVGYGLETAGLKPFNAFYLESGADPADPLVSPIKRQDLTGLPPALVITAEHDPLRDEGELYGRRLEGFGVAATVSRYDGANHGFVQNFSWIPEFYRVFEETAEFLKAAK
ncbi:alpha/beta hydrolase [Arthrobacter sp. Leaf137]|uniref:alpha/beta hydrolase n=1 Tax=Arthrobacter sp. Leaf137 TaxID=1736271 RepID=UPI0006F6DF13|nr:alpha/beta hydrolase [Arthrobacter sp. Leaf137]KQQ90018.1 alpha/beta hydrolase [Arthrobacter sp. Leaf137]